MGAGRRTQTFVFDSASSLPNQIKHTGGFRYLTKKQLGGVIFGCKDNTMNECILKQLFGLPAPHFSYLKNIDPGLPLFLFNYSNRELHGIFEAASSGEMHINPYAWTSDGSADAEEEIKPMDPESIFLVGGYDGVSWLSTLESYSPSNVVLKSLKAMNSVRSYASVAKLYGELYVFRGRTGRLWYDTVESYSPADNEWTLRSSLHTKKGTLASATLKDKFFAIDSGNGIDCFSEVDYYKRFSLAAAELNGALYAVGGYDVSNYLATAERFDPREHSWTKIKSMSSSRGCHALAVLDGKLYAIGGYDGSTMVPSTEIYDPVLEHGWLGSQWSTREGIQQLLF
ncbi:hypothetical protein RND71_035821 [Anisodus tanguticus]|uniref:DCD domain-containing protein n=1 Tax=Anisodus tanguticus TaxID=243964 RepID=A0AAE1R5R8_9SOLA|nr:hypothetical protein RND71_035821 [Anisodus tanguticus]